MAIYLIYRKTEETQIKTAGNIARYLFLQLAIYAGTGKSTFVAGV